MIERELILKIREALLADNKPDLESLVSDKLFDEISYDFAKMLGRDIVDFCGTAGAVECAQYLIDECDFDVNAQKNKHPAGFVAESPINEAIRSGQLKMIKFLANHPKININTFYQDGSALECALDNRNYKAADIIIDAAPQIMDSMQWTGHARDYQMKAIEVACKYDDLEPIKYIVGKTENNEIFAKGAGVALHHENDRVFNYLVENGLDVDVAMVDYAATPDTNVNRVNRNVARLIDAGARFRYNSFEAPKEALKQSSSIPMDMFVKNGFDVNSIKGMFLDHLLVENMISELGKTKKYGADFKFLNRTLMMGAVDAYNRYSDNYYIRQSPEKDGRLDAIIAMKRIISDGVGQPEHPTLKERLDAIVSMKEILSGGTSDIGYLTLKSTDTMQDALVDSIRDNNVDKTLRLLELNNNDFPHQYQADELLMAEIGHSVLSWCLENDSVDCAKAVIENKLCNINACAGGKADIMPPLDTALSNHSNEIVSLLLEQPDLYYNNPHSGVTALERALIDRNYDGAELLLKERPVILNMNADIFGPVYHQIKAAEISVYGDTRPVELIIKHTPGNRVLPSAGLAVLESRSANQDGIKKAIDKLFELGLDANELLVGVCGEANLKDYQDNINHIRLCLDHGADFSFGEFSGPRLLASRSVRPEKFSALLDSGLDLNVNNGSILKKAASERDYSAFQTLIDAGCDPELLDKPVRDYVLDFDSLDELSQNEVFFMEKLAAKASQSNENNSPALNM